MQTEQPLFLNATKAARLLGVSRTTFYRRVQDGSVQPRQFGLRNVYLVAELNQVLKQGVSQ